MGVKEDRTESTQDRWYMGVPVKSTQDRWYMGVKEDRTELTRDR